MVDEHKTIWESFLLSVCEEYLSESFFTWSFIAYDKQLALRTLYDKWPMFSWLLFAESPNCPVL
jgi:hypothetical protein